jgi:hypothetical protein
MEYALTSKTSTTYKCKCKAGYSPYGDGCVLDTDFKQLEKDVIGGSGVFSAYQLRYYSVSGSS